MTSAFRAIDLSMRYRGTMALNELNLDVPQGSVFALLGPNGAGKTTTIKILMNILRPTSGRAEVLGKDSRLLSPQNLERIGYVSENQAMPDWMTLGYLFRYLEPFYPSWDRNRAAELVHQFQLPADRKLRHFSRGMWMKAALASSLAYRPDLLVLDEPFTGLDPLVREDLIGGIIDAAGESTILLSSHDLGDIESFATHVAYIDHGRLWFSEEMDSLIARFREVEVVVDAPAVLPANGAWPTEWLRPEVTASVIRFVDSRFDESLTSARISELLTGVRNVAVNPMPLRTIFVTLARSTSV